MLKTFAEREQKMLPVNVLKNKRLNAMHSGKIVTNLSDDKDAAGQLKKKEKKAKS